MYTTTMKVPYITEATIAEVLEIAPNLQLVQNLPVIQTPEQASAAATVKMHEVLKNAKYEYVKEINNVTLDEKLKLWTVHFTISGD